MKKELPKAYEASNYEDEIYKNWEDSGFFNPDNLEGKNGTYCNILPPPNANGELHIGHTSGYAVMDLLGRYQRMRGKKTLLLPGKDHAGIQTQVVFEKKIKAEKDMTRHDMGREEFYNSSYNFCMDRANYMRNQERKIGLSADWSREKFTLDPKILNTVLETFTKMYNEVDKDGNRMVYRGERIINWCPRCASALADVEVEHEEQKSSFYTLKYSKDFPFTIATTRPETKLADTAVAVNPKDKRYKEFIGNEYEVDFVGVPLKIKVIADRNVDMEFGTGAIGVTPGHSAVDWHMAVEHKLEIKKLINEKAVIMEGYGKYSGRDVKEAREMVIDELKKRGLIEKEVEIDNNISVCERCKTTIEPLVSLQWFVNVDHDNFSLKKEARKAIENGEINIYPERFKKIMLNWIDNVHDWCISRQIWWGPQIPVYYKGDEIKVGVEAPSEEGWTQDEDTFDTWFSSGQWAYTTLGYPEGEDYKAFYPSDTMIMGRDILPFWAFRMIILSLYRTKKVPFKNLYFTGLIRDEKGQKMSKSKGNGIEPLEMIENYGTDAVRLSLLIGAAPGNDMNLGETKIAGFRNMVNKLWNVSRFALQNINKDIKELVLEEIKSNDLSLSDKWIFSKMRDLIKEVNKDMEKYRFSQAGESLREFTWKTLADWYLEASKFENSSEKEKVLARIITDLLKLWHPFIPFVTEAIWGEFNDSLIMVDKWPVLKVYDNCLDGLSEKEIEKFSFIISLIEEIRNARAENKVEPAKKVKAVIYAGNKIDLIKSQTNVIKSLRTGINDLEIKEKGDAIENEIAVTVGGIQIYLIGAIDMEKEKERIAKEIGLLNQKISNAEKKLSNDNFVSKAPESVVQEQRELVENWKKELNILQNNK